MMGKSGVPTEINQISSSGRENKKPSYLKDYARQITIPNDGSDKDFNENEFSDEVDGSDESFVHGAYKKKKNKRGPRNY